MRPYQGGIDEARLGTFFRAMSVPTRVQLLAQLQVPKTAAELEMLPFRKHRDLREDRALSTPAVERHLEALREAGLVRSRLAQREGREVREYLVNPGELADLADEVRRLTLLRPAPGAAAGWSRTHATAQESSGRGGQVELPPGPAFVLAGGPLEGVAFPLTGSGPWTVGRSDQCALRIPLDPYVSGENTIVTQDEGAYWVRDLAASSNGTMHNWRLLDRGEVVRLRSGDTVGIGRTLMLFRDPA